MLITSDRRKTDTECHDKRYRHRSCRNSAGIKRDGQKIPWDEKCQNENNAVKYNQQMGQGNGKKHTQYSDDEKDTDTKCHG